MKLPAFLRNRRHRKSQPGQGLRIRSLDDLHGHFPWPDLGTRGLACREIRNPLAVAVRAVKVVEYTQASGSEYGDDGMVLLGLADALCALGRHGEWEAVGTLFNALEALIPSVDRPRWLGGLDPYIGPERRVRD